MVNEPYTEPDGLTTPMVPRDAARRPSAANTWRVKSATDVLPLVPVIATTLRGCSGCRRAAICANAKRGSVAVRMGVAAGATTPTPGLVRMATAPLARASAINRLPSVLLPAKAAKIMPGRTWRLSAVTPAMRAFGSPDARAMSALIKSLICIRSDPEPPRAPVAGANADSPPFKPLTFAACIVRRGPRQM